MPRGQYDRTSRAAESRVNEDRSVEEREDDYIEPIFIDGTSGGFPKIPPIAGYHVCWVRIPTQLVPDANNVQQFIKNYGYEPVRPEEIAGFDYLAGQNAVAGGAVIQHKDTIACKTPTRRYKGIMAGFDEKAAQQYASVGSKPKLGPQRSDVSVSMNRNTRPFRTVEFEE